MFVDREKLLDVGEDLSNFGFASSWKDFSFCNFEHPAEIYLRRENQEKVRTITQERQEGGAVFRTLTMQSRTLTYFSSVSRISPTIFLLFSKRASRSFSLLIS